jgi:hypothetical protein
MLARRQSVFVRPLSMDEGRKLQRISRTAKDPVRLRRAIVVMMSGQGRTVPDITSLLPVSEDYVRDVIHAFNERPRRWTQNGIGDRIREWICRSHTGQIAALAGYVRWYNIRAQPKVNFATDSPIRTWTDYPAQGCVTSH